MFIKKGKETGLWTFLNDFLGKKPEVKGEFLFHVEGETEDFNAPRVYY